MTWCSGLGLQGTTSHIPALVIHLPFSGAQLPVSPVKGSRTQFLHSLVTDLQSRFASGTWIDEKGLEPWLEVSSCSCERVFSFMTQSDYGQNVGARTALNLWGRGVVLGREL
jgi:hypothetical protein